MPTTRQAIYDKALEAGLRESTVRSYCTLLGRIGILETQTDQVTREGLLEALWALDNPNTRRATVIAIRSVLGITIKIPRAIPRRYDLPDEDTLRLAFMTSPHEVRYLLMAYGGLRLGEACAVTAADVEEPTRLRVDKQVNEATGRIGPVKAAEGTVRIPEWLGQRVSSIQETAKPASVRESLRRASARVGVALNPHQLRHWHATHLLERGVPLIAVSRQLRHSDVATTLRTYAQASDDVVLEAWD